VPRITAFEAQIGYCPAMPHTYSSLLVHCVFSTKERMNLIREPQTLWRYFHGIARGKNIPLVAASGTANHVHLLLDLPPTLQLAQALQHLKGNSSHWLNGEHPPFAWQQGYGAFAIGESQRQTVIHYIAGQAEHHKKWSFEQEFVTLLRKYGIQYDERFVFG
jgi:putative transposase